VTSDQPPQPSYEALVALVVELRLLVSTQAAMIAEQAERIAELERQAGSDSHNSSKPPSRHRQRAEAQGQSPGRAATRPQRRVPAVHDRLRGPVRQQPGRARPADGQGATADLRILTGARRFARIRSYISTVRKHGINPLTALRDLFVGRPWMLPATS
jgi:transposase